VQRIADLIHEEICAYATKKYTTTMAQCLTGCHSVIVTQYTKEPKLKVKVNMTHLFTLSDWHVLVRNAFARTKAQLERTLEQYLPSLTLWKTSMNSFCTGGGTRYLMRTFDASESATVCASVRPCIIRARQCRALLGVLFACGDHGPAHETPHGRKRYVLAAAATVVPLNSFAT